MLIILPFLFASCSDNSQAPDIIIEEHRVPLEVGDAIYRDLGLIPETHVGIFYRYTGGDPDDHRNYDVIEAPGEPRPVSIDPFPTFLDGKAFYVGYTAGVFGYLDYSTREKILVTAKELVHADPPIPYVPLGQFLNVLLPDWTDGFWDGTVGDIKNLRCDGVVEYAYEANGVNVWGWNEGAKDEDICQRVRKADYDNRVGNLWGHNSGLTPDAQRGYKADGYTHMRASKPEDPTPVSNLVAASHDERGEPTNLCDNRIRVTWDDATDPQSGIWGYYIRVDQSPTSIPTHLDHAVARVDVHSDTEAAFPIREGYDSEWTSPPLVPGSYYVHVRSVDNAGNWGNISGEAACTAHTNLLTILPLDDCNEWRVGPYVLTFSWVGAYWQPSADVLGIVFRQLDRPPYPVASVEIINVSSVQAGVPVIPELLTCIVESGVVVYTNSYWNNLPNGQPCHVTFSQLDLSYLGQVSGTISGHVYNTMDWSSQFVSISGSFENVTVFLKPASTIGENLTGRSWNMRRDPWVLDLRGWRSRFSPYRD